jgi:hypothetical protein
MLDTPKPSEAINGEAPPKHKSLTPGGKKWVKFPTFIAGWTALVFFVASLALAWCGRKTPLQPLCGIKLAEVICLFVWTIGPPIWFWIEFHWVGFSGWDNSDPTRSLDFVKYSQELSTKVWLAVTSGLLLLYFGKDIHL